MYQKLSKFSMIFSQLEHVFSYLLIMMAEIKVPSVFGDT